MPPTTTAPSSSAAAPTPKQQFLTAYEKEHGTTMRVLRAYPRDKAELKPHPKAKTARELAWIFAVEQGAMEKVLTTGFDFSAPPAFPPAPDSFDAIISALDPGQKRIAGLIAGMSDEDLLRTAKFFTAPKTIGDVPRLQLLWMMLSDQIHHRGQFSIYLRMADGKVPSIYGPSLDEPWF
jgi:uncharacterized damage-inducible protein DinB